MNTTLVIMAAGIGSRFGGGVKQLTPVGPNGEIIIDYSNKRNEAHKSNIYNRRKTPEKWTDAKKTLDDAKKKNGGKIPPELVKGKFLKKKINGAMKKKWGYERQIISDSDAIDSPRLKEIAELLRENKL